MKRNSGKLPAVSEGPGLLPPDAFDPVIEVYKKDVDRTLLRENLKLTTEQRSQKFQRGMALVYELRRVAERMRSEKR